jgi:hypothetical protein
MPKPSPDLPLTLESLVDCVFVIIQFEGRVAPRVYQETAREAEVRRSKVRHGIFDFVLQENGIRPGPLRDFERLARDVDYCDLDEWCVRLRLAMDCVRRGYTNRDVKIVVELRWPPAGTKPRTETAPESRAKGTEGGDHHNPPPAQSRA